MRTAFFKTMLAPLALVLTMFAAAPVLAQCVSGPLCPSTTSPAVVNPVLNGITVNFAGVNDFRSIAAVLEGTGGAGTDGNGAVISDLALVFNGAGLCPDDPNCTAVGLQGSITSAGNSYAWAWATDPVLAQTAGTAQMTSVIMLQVEIGDIFPDTAE